MAQKMTVFEKEVEGFRKWLVSSARISKTSAKDCISRCRRVEKELKIELFEAVSDVTEYVQLIKKVKRISFTADLRAACRKYADYKFPTKSKHYQKFLR